MAYSKITVLVVEDEPLVRMGIVDHLEDSGFTVLEAADADAAIHLLVKNLDIRIVFTDVDMPGSMDGLKLAAAISKRWPPIKIVVTSGHRKVNTNDLPVEAHFFAKPYSFDKLVTAFRSLASH